MAKKHLISIILILSAMSWCLNANNDREREPRHFDDAKVIRVKYVTGETFIKRDYDEAMEEGSVNLPVFQKDNVNTTDGRIELYMGRLNYLRLDYDTSLMVVEAPELRKTRSTFRLNKGGMILDIADLDYEKDIEIQTPDCGVFIMGRGVYRINVLEGNKTEFIVYKGRAEISGEKYHKVIRKNQKVALSEGKIFERPYFFNTIQRDDFDSWSNNRASKTNYSRSYGSRYLDKGYSDKEAELSRSGRWKYSSDFGKYIWIPYNISEGWRPYSNGRWVWNPHYGYVWTSYDPWGWTTHHYGRWHWSILDGWYWIPGYRWSSAWVSWCWNDSYYGWSPLSYYNRPVIVINGRWHRHYRYRRGIPFHSRSTIIIKRGHIGHSRISRVSIRKSPYRSSVRVVHRGSSPTRRISYSSVRRVNAQGRSVTVKSWNKNGSTSVRRVSKDRSRVFRYSPSNRNRVVKKSNSRRVISRYGDTSVRRKSTNRKVIKKRNTRPSAYRRSYNDSDLRTVRKSRVNTTTIKRTPVFKPQKKKIYESSRENRKNYKPGLRKSSSNRNSSYKKYTPSSRPSVKSRQSSSSRYRSYSPSSSRSIRKYKPSTSSKSSSYRKSTPSRRSGSIKSSRSYSPSKRSISRSRSSSRSYSSPRKNTSSSSRRSSRGIKRKK